MHSLVIVQLRASPAASPYSTAFLFITGRAPGIPVHTGQQLVLGLLPNLVEQAQIS